MARFHFSRLVLPALPALVLLFMPAVCPAQCVMCGDLDGNGTSTSSDFIAVTEWLGLGIPPLYDIGCFDIDGYRGVTVRDATLWWWCIPKAATAAAAAFPECEWWMECESPPFDPYPLAPPQPYWMTYNDIFPADDSVVTLRLRLQSHRPFLGLSVPLGITVGGEVPLLSNLVVEQFWGTRPGFGGGSIEVPDAPPGHLLLGVAMVQYPVPPDYLAIAEVDLHLPPAAANRYIDVEVLSTLPDRTQMMLDDELGGWELGLVPCRVTVPGDVNGDGAVTSADIIYLVITIFSSGPLPIPCPAAGDMDCTGTITASDIIWLVNHVFKGGPAPCDVCALIADGTWDCP